MRTTTLRQRGGGTVLMGALVLAITACGGGSSSSGGAAGGSGGGGGGGGPAAGSLTLETNSPGNNAIQKADYPVTAVFSAPVDPASVDMQSFAVTAGVNEVNGSFSYSDDGSVVIFTPDADLVDGQDYDVTLDGLTSQSGAPLDGVWTWTFTANAVANYDCAVGPVPPTLRLRLNADQNAYYSQRADANGLPVLGGDQVSAPALTHACETILGMMSLRQDLLEEMIANGTIAAVTGDGEGITQIPAYSDLDTVFPITGSSWDERARGGLGATKARPVSSGTEENVLCYANDPYQAGGVHEDIFLHEFAHSVDLMALEDRDPAFRDEVRAAYDDAIANNLYTNTYAADNVEEYWAEGVQTWFNANLESDPPNGLHNSVNTRAELESYDPALHGLISRIFPTDYDGGCPPGAP